MEKPLPEDWVKEVVRILHAGAIGREILVTHRALQDWELATMRWSHELVDTLKDYFAGPRASGRLVEGMADPGETYEFIFKSNSKALYGKVCLMRGKLKVKVISAHRPLKGETL